MIGIARECMEVIEASVDDMEDGMYEIRRYQKEILRLLRILWSQPDLRMWRQIYTAIKCFVRDKEGKT